MTAISPIAVLLAWLVGVLYGAYLRERHTTDRSLIELVTDS